MYVFFGGCQEQQHPKKKRSKSSQFAAYKCTGNYLTVFIHFTMPSILNGSSLFFFSCFFFELNNTANSFFCNVKYETNFYTMLLSDPLASY